MQLKILAQVILISFLCTIPQMSWAKSEGSTTQSVLKDQQSIGHYMYNGVNRIIVPGSSDATAHANYMHLREYLSKTWEKQDGYVGLDQVNVMIHVYPDVINVEVFTTWHIAMSSEDLLNDAPEILRRESYAFIFEFTDSIMDDADERFAEKIELIIMSIISEQMPDEREDPRDQAPSIPREEPPQKEGVEEKTFRTLA